MNVIKVHLIRNLTFYELIFRIELNVIKKIKKKKNYLVIKNLMRKKKINYYVRRASLQLCNVHYLNMHCCCSVGLY